MANISIVMPVYNGEKHIKESILSVLKQSYKDFELIVVNDASTDRTQEIIDSFSDERIKCITCERNRHVAYAANLGLANATGKYIARLDSDDIWNSDKLDKQVKYMETHPEMGACFTRVYIIDKDGNLAGDKFSQIENMFNGARNRTPEEWARFFFYYGNCLCNTSGLVRTAALDTIGRLHNIAYVPGQDFETWSRLVEKYPIYILEEKLTYYRWEENKQKISSLKESGVSAFENVHMMMRVNYLEEMKNQDFIRIFSKEFVNKTSRTDLELECEKAFLLMTCTKSTGDINFLGLLKIQKILNMPKGLETLEEKYDFKLREFYQKYRVRNFYSYNIANEIQNLKSKENILQKENESLTEEIINLKNIGEARDKKIGECEQKIVSLIDFNNRQKEDLQKINQILDNERNLSTLINNENSMLKDSLQITENRLRDIEESFTWHLFKPIRKIEEIIKERKRKW